MRERVQPIGGLVKPTTRGARVGDVEIYTDGAVAAIRAGGWAALLFGDTSAKSPARTATTNNRMELTAVIRALEALKRRCGHIYTDSQYVRQGCSNGCRSGRRAAGKPRQEAGQEPGFVAGARRTRAAAQLEWHWVKGIRQRGNERVDELANRAIDALSARLRAMRQIVLDVETTGLDASAGHRIIEIGCVELVNRRPPARNSIAT